MPFSRLPGGRATRVALAWVLLVAAPAAGQDQDWNTLPGGRLRLGVTGIFTSADERFGQRSQDGASVSGVESLARDLQAQNGATLFPGYEPLTASLAFLTGNAAYNPVLGASEAYLQASQVRVPFELELGITDWLTVGATVPLVRSRLEGELALLPTAGDDVGVNPAFAREAQVRGFTDALLAAAQALPSGQADTWTAWADQWVRAYGSGPLFPAQGTAVAGAMAAALADFNAVLASAGVPTVDQSIPLADAPLSYADLRALLSNSQANLGTLPLPTALLWNLGDIRIHGRLRLLRGPDDAVTGRPAWGLVALGSVSLPTGRYAEPRTLLPIQESQAVPGVSVGGAGWLRTGRLGIAASGQVGIFQAGEVTRRIGAPDQVILPRDNTAIVERSPGLLLELEARPSIRMGRSLWIEGAYRFLDQGRDEYLRVSPVPGIAAGPIPGGPTATDAALLELESSVTLHVVGGGLRYQPPEGAFPVEAWARVEGAVAGSGGRTLKELRLTLGGRFTRDLW